MSTNHQFSIAIHILSVLGFHQGESISSAQLAKSVNANPSFVRRILARLSKAGLIQTTKGKNGCCALAKSASAITLFDIYEAVEAPQVFSIHSYADQKSCQVSCGIKSSLVSVLDRTQKSMEKTLMSTRLSDVISDIK